MFSSFEINGMICNMCKKKVHIYHHLLFYILKSLYFCMRSCFLTRLTYEVPSWVTSRISNISLVDEHCDTLKNLSKFNAEVMILFATQSYWGFFFNIRPVSPWFFDDFLWQVHCIFRSNNVSLRMDIDLTRNSRIFK